MGFPPLWLRTCACQIMHCLSLLPSPPTSEARLPSRLIPCNNRHPCCYCGQSSPPTVWPRLGAPGSQVPDGSPSPSRSSLCLSGIQSLAPLSLPSCYSHVSHGPEADPAVQPNSGILWPGIHVPSLCFHPLPGFQNPKHLLTFFPTVPTTWSLSTQAIRS